MFFYRVFLFSFSLYGLSPEEALLPDNTAFLQQKIFKARRDKAQKYLKKRPPFEIGDKVRKIIRDKFKQRVNTHKWSSEKYTITGVRKTAPWTFFLSGNGKKSFYSQKDTPLFLSESVFRNNAPQLIVLSAINACC